MRWMPAALGLALRFAINLFVIRQVIEVRLQESEADQKPASSNGEVWCRQTRRAAT
jgi:hypothetical protein